MKLQEAVKLLLVVATSTSWGDAKQDTSTMEQLRIPRRRILQRNAQLIDATGKFQGHETNGLGRSHPKRRSLQHSKYSRSKTKSCKSTKGSSHLKVIQKNPKGSKGDESGVLCFRGRSQDVTDACAAYNANCCEGVQACYWEDDNNEVRTVCQGSCNGESSCKWMPPNAYIGVESCVGYFACNGLNENSQECEPVIVGDYSCRGDKSCTGICAASTNCKVEIGRHACHDQSACFSVSSQASGVSTVEIKSYACSYDSQYGNQCSFLGFNSPANVFVGEYACNGERACRFVGLSATDAESIEIGALSCASQQSCSYVGQFVTGNEILVEEGSCSDFKSCEFVGRNAAEVAIEKNACESTYSCQQVGTYAPDSVSIGSSACSLHSACRGVGFRIDEGEVYIGKKACDMYEDQCSALADSSCFYTSFIPKGGTSCS